GWQTPSAKSASRRASRPRRRGIPPRCSPRCRGSSSAPAARAADPSVDSTRSSSKATTRTSPSPPPPGRSSTAPSCCPLTWHCPPIDPLRSVSRLMNDVAPAEHVDAAARLRALLAAYRDAEDLIHVGAYVKGSSPEIDLAVQARPAILKFLKQGIGEKTTLDA